MDFVVLVDGKPTVRNNYIRHYKTFETAMKYATEIIDSYKNLTISTPKVEVAVLDFTQKIEIK